MQSRTDQIVAELEADWPNYQVWVVYRATQPSLWCARRWDGTGNTLNASTPAELVDQLEEQASHGAASTTYRHPGAALQNTIMCPAGLPPARSRAAWAGGQSYSTRTL